MGDERPPPPISIHDPARPGQPVDVLVLGDEAPRPRLLTRRRLQRGAALLAVAAVVAAGLEVRDRRATQERERREAGVVDLAVLPGADVDAADGLDRAGGISLRHIAQLRNDGPRAVTVLTGGIGAFGVVHEVVLRPGATTPVLLEQAVPCGDDLPPRQTSTSMSLAVETDAGVRQLELELATPLTDPAAQVCGLLRASPVTAQLVDVEVRRGSVRLSIDATTRAPQPVTAVAAAADLGFAVRVPELADGPRELPLPVLDIGVGVLRLTAEVSLVDCAEAEAFREPNRPATLTVLFESADGGDSEVRVVYDPDLLQDLVAQAC